MNLYLREAETNPLLVGCRTPNTYWNACLYLCHADASQSASIYLSCDTSAVGDSHILPPALTRAWPRRPFVPWNSCAGCWNGEDPKKIVICDDCDVEYHTYCLTPPLDEVRGPPMPYPCAEPCDEWE